MKTLYCERVSFALYNRGCTSGIAFCHLSINFQDVSFPRKFVSNFH